MEISRSGALVEVRAGHEVIRVEPWGPDSLRVRAALGEIASGLPGALVEAPAASTPEIETGDDWVSISNGAIKAVIVNENDDGGTCIIVRFVRADTGEDLLSERRAHYWWPGPRVFGPLGGGRYRLEQHFQAYEQERLYGLGQHTGGRLDQKGMVLDLVHRNAEVSVPFVLSSRGYGLLWNNPAVGHVELAHNRTRWVADAARQIDYWITAGTPAAIIGNYAGVTGRAPKLPAWATGFWQSKYRYRTQDELLSVAREYHRRGIPLAVIVVDFFHWTAAGDWRFAPADWPDPEAMVAELRSMGTRLMVSIWPLVSQCSSNRDEMVARGLLVRSERGLSTLTEFPEKGRGNVPAYLYDSTNPEARAFIWDRCRSNYLQNGISAFWLDACEPELRLDPANLRLHAGPGDEVVNLYPLEHARAFYEGMRAAGEDDVVLLCRSAWAGSARYGAAVWSGDIPATFESLAAQIRAGLNIGVSGIPWWTTDIGGFFGGDPTDPAYRELLVRWFEYGAFCPLFRLHGYRFPRDDESGGPNEVWSFGPEVYDLVCGVIRLRERIRPYIDAQMQRAHTDGLPPMRPLFVDFPDDHGSWLVEDEFMLGPDILVAPVSELGARSRDVYLPRGRWSDAWSGTELTGPRTITASAPLERIPVFLREGASIRVSAERDD